MPEKVWYNSVGSGSGSKLTLRYDSITVSGSTAKLKNPEIEFYSKSGWSDSVNSIDAKGSAVSDERVHSGSLNGGTRTWDCSATDITLTFGATQTKTFIAEVYGISFFNGDSSTNQYSWTITFPQRPYAAPNAPTSLALKRVSDTTQRFTFAGHQTSKTADRYTQYVDWDLQTDSDTATWVKKGSGLSGSTSSVDVTGTSENHRYRVRVKFRNSGGSSSYAVSDWIATTPDYPAVMPPSKSGSVVTANWGNVAPFLTGSKLGWRENGGAEFDPGIAVGAAATSATRTVDPAKTHAYRVYHLIAGVPLAAGGTTTLTSPGSEWSQTVQLQGPPLAPTVTLSHVVFDAESDTLVVSVAANPVDGSAQTAAEIQYRIGTAAWTVVQLGTATQYAFAPPALANGNKYEIQARTKAADPSFGQWSPSKFVDATETPGVIIQSPADGTTVLGAALNVQLSWTDDDPAGLTAYDMVLLDSANSVLWHAENLPGSIADALYRVPYSLVDSETYTLRVRGRDSLGLWSDWVDASWPVAYAKPPEATIVSTEWRPSEGVIVVEVENPAPGVGETAGSSQELQWLNGDRWLVAASDLPVLDPGMPLFVTHWTPPTHTTVTYRVVTRSDAPSIKVGAPFDVETPADGWVYLNGGPDFTQLARIRGDADVVWDGSREKTLVTPVGRRKAVELIGNAESDVWKISGRVARRQMQEHVLGTQAEWFPVKGWVAPICLRDYTGLRTFVSVSGVSIRRKTGDVSFVCTEVDHVE